MAGDSLGTQVATEIKERLDVGVLAKEEGSVTSRA